MALIQCTECKYQISEHAKRCPQCGFPRENPIAAGYPRSMAEWTILSLVLVGALSFSFYNYSMISKQQKEQQELSKRQLVQEKYQLSLFQRSYNAMNGKLEGESHK